MWIIWVLLFLALVGVASIIGFVKAKPSDKYDDNLGRGISAGIFVSALVLGVALLLLNSVKVVGANEIGVASTLGTDVRSVGSGLHLVNPVSDVVKYPTRPRTVVVTARIRTADAGFVNVQFSSRWGVSRDDATLLFGQFPKSSTDEIEKEVVTPNVIAAAAAYYGGLTNEEAVDGREAEKNAGGVESRATLLLAKYGVHVDAVQIRQTDPDPKTADSIARVAAQKRETAVAAESVNTAIQQGLQQKAAANGLRVAAEQVANLTDAEYKVLCLQAAERISNKNTERGIPTYSLPCQENQRTVTGK